MKVLEIQARKVLNVCHFYGITIEENYNRQYFIITGDVGSYALMRLHEAAEECNMVLVLNDSQLIVQYNF